MTRPEGALVFLAQLPFRARRALEEKRFGEIAAWSTAFLGPVATHLAWRWLHYGELLPNTFYAKVGLSIAVVWRGLDYVLAYVGSAGGALLLPALLAPIVAGKRARIVAIPVAALGMAVVLEGGDAFPGFRFLVPTLPLFYLLLADVMEFTLHRSRTWLVYAAVVPLIVLHVHGSARSALDERNLSNLVTRRMRIAGAGLAEALPAGTTVALNPIGAIAHHCIQCRIIDMLGLTDRTIARTPVPDLGYGQAGHERGNGAYVLGRRPDVILFGNVLISSPGAPKGIGLNAPWRPVHRSERELAALPVLEDQYVRDWLDLSEGRHLLFLRRRDFTVPGARATSP